MKYALLTAVLLTRMMSGQVVITDSGSTNRPGMTVTVDDQGHASIEGRAGAKAEMDLESPLFSRLMEDVKAAMPLDQLKVAHCMKSVSFGSRMWVSYNGVKSPDVSCPGQTDGAVVALVKDVQEVMGLAKAKMPQSGRLR